MGVAQIMISVVVPVFRTKFAASSSQQTGRYIYLGTSLHTPNDFVTALKARPGGEMFLRDEGELMLLNIIEYDMR